MAKVTGAFKQLPLPAHQNEMKEIDRQQDRQDGRKVARDEMMDGKHVEEIKQEETKTK
jgi:hypothetical protein